MNNYFSKKSTFNTPPKIANTQNARDRGASAFELKNQLSKHPIYQRIKQRENELSQVQSLLKQWLEQQSIGQPSDANVLDMQQGTLTIEVENALLATQVKHKTNSLLKYLNKHLDNNMDNKTPCSNIKVQLKQPIATIKSL